MAAARERIANPYDDGGGFGKFRKRPFRRSTQTTPYDRPQAAIRNPSLASGGNNNNNNGWLSKLVDPTQRFIASSAHRLFASFFRKRLPPPPPPSPPQPSVPEVNQGTMDKQKEAISTGSSETKSVAGNGCDAPVDSSDGNGFTKLQLILKKKTFTRSEIDQLTALLQSRSADIGEEENNSNVMASEVGPSKVEEFPDVLAKDNRIECCLIPAPVVVEDASTPANLAKSYMHSRLSKVSPSTLTLRSHLARDGSPSLTNVTYSLDSPITSLMSRPPGFSANGFVTPRSRGRSAIYHMARTPYSRVHSTINFEGAGSAVNAVSGPSLSRSAWGGNKWTDSKIGRRSSVLENDNRSIGAIRRIRQKSNILPTSGALSNRGTGFGSDSAQPPVPAKIPASGSETLVDNEENSIHQSGLKRVPSKSSEMALKILQQLDALVSSREKSPTKLPTPMVVGSALKSLDHIEKYLGNIHGKNQLDAKGEKPSSDLRDMMWQQDKVKENEPTIFGTTKDKSTSVVNEVDAAVEVAENENRAFSFSTMKSVDRPASQRKQSFQMSAHEDYLELDDDDATASATLSEVREKRGTSTETKGNLTKIATPAKSPASPEAIQPTSSELNKKSDKVPDGYAILEKKGTTFQDATSPSVTIHQAVILSPSTAPSDKDASPKELNVPPIFNFGTKVFSQMEPNGSSTMLDFNSKTEDKAPNFAVSTTTSAVFSDSLVVKFDDSSDAKPESSSRLACVDVSAETRTKRTNLIDVNSTLDGTSPAITSTERPLFGDSSSATLSSGSTIFGGTASGFKSIGSNMFNFSAVASADQPRGTNSFSDGGAHTSADGISSSTPNMPSQFGLSVSSSSSGLAGNTPLVSDSSLFNSSSSMGNMFSSSANFGMTLSSPASGVNTVISSIASSSTVFGASWQTTRSPVSVSTFSSSSSSTGFVFGASVSSTATSGTSMVFGSLINAPSGSTFPFSSPAPATSMQPVFSNSNSTFAFGLSGSSNNDQMNVEDSMAEDTVQASAPAAPLFNQPAFSPSSGFVFDATIPSGLGQFGSSTASMANPFQFGSQPNLAALQNTSPFQTSGSLEFNAGGSFSLGAGGGDKASRKIVRVKRVPRKR
ncbi:hypothetical protein K2173_008880 [Erythroxylum novogranatense]|uniref:Nuclear pore complex protein NUP1-like n=1 Tax=Erythroxylum novogranatense TaxID=1862640 RepID=A0AAV8S582_9ROSI|nr:hypothetical protein K2173_008880 [Erythroxylum novogranatense]